MPSQGGSAWFKGLSPFPDYLHAGTLCGKHQVMVDIEWVPGFHIRDPDSASGSGLYTSHCRPLVMKEQVEALSLSNKMTRN